MLSQKISGAKVRRIRELRGLSVAALADTAGCSRWHIYKIEQGRGQPSAQVCAAIRKALQAGDTELAEESA